MKSNSIKKDHEKFSDKKDIINDKKEELYIEIEANSPERNESNGKGSPKKEETFLELNRAIDKKSIKNEIEEKVSNLNRIKEKYYNLLGKKRNKTDLTTSYPKCKRKNDHKKKQKPKEYINKHKQKSQGSNNTQENFIQIINLFPYSYDKSNNINLNYTENKSNNESNNRSTIDLSLNTLWINCINDVLSHSKENNENENNVKEESTPPRTFKIKDINDFTLSSSNSNNISDLNNKNRSKSSEKFVDIGYKQENNNSPVANDLAISNFNGIKADSELSIKEENPNN